MSKEENIFVSFKNVDDRKVLTKKVNNSFTIGEIRKKNPTDTNLWAEIKFDSIPLLHKVELMNLKENNLRLTFDLDLGQLVSNEIDEKLHTKRAYSFEDEMWKEEKEIMSILDSTELAISWGGGNSPEISAESELYYYFDDEVGYVIVERTTKSVNEIDNLTMKQIYESGQALSMILSKVISKTLIIK